MPSNWTLAWTDEFADVDSMRRWVGGHLNLSQEGSLNVRQGVRISFVEGVEYASAGVITREALPGDFAAEVDFSVTSPLPGTTFELAAITSTPPAKTFLKPASLDECSLVFNVHGEPPFVSSEFDEDDGWRISWNEHEPLFEQLADGTVIADGRNNVYGRKAPPFPNGPASGSLRLVREGGQRWSVWRRGSPQEPWVHVPARRSPKPALSGPVHLRLVAKHWVKRAEELTFAPANQIVFHRFSLWQRAVQHGLLKGRLGR